MAAGIEACSDLFAIARPVTGRDLEKMCVEAPPSKWSPHLLQLGVFITSVGAARSATSNGHRPDAVCGHSLGEFAALVGCGSISFQEASELVSVRGLEMAKAGSAHPGGMAAVLGLAENRISEICDATDDLWVANFNSSVQTVISGTDDALAKGAEACLGAGARRVVRLDVPVAAHTPLMEGAAEAVGQVLLKIDIKRPRSEFYSAALAAKLDDPADIASSLTTGITSPVRFSQTLKAIRDNGIGTFLEIGPGNVLQGLVKQNLPDVDRAGISSDSDARELASSLAGNP